MQTLKEAELYSKVLFDELKHAKLRLQSSEREGRKIIKQQIREIKQDIVILEKIIKGMKKCKLYKR